MKTYTSKHNPNRHWELWTSMPGRRTIECIQYGQRTSVARVECEKKRAVFTGKSYYTPTQWSIYAPNGMYLGTHKSPEAAFNAFVSCL